METTIFISTEISPLQVEEIESIKTRAELYNPFFSGREISIKYGNYNCVECADEVEGTKLLRQIQLISGE